MSVNKNKDKKYYSKFIEDDEFFGNDISEIVNEYLDKDDEDEKDKGFCNDNKECEGYFNENDGKIRISCGLKVDIGTKNKMIYLYPGKSQFFTVDVSKCCGDVTIRYKGCYTDKGIKGNLARYRIVQSGIIADAYNRIDPRKKDVLHFIAIDECTKECIEFVVIFSCTLCEHYC